MIVLDVETGGLDPKKHSIVSVGAVDFLNPKNTFYGECRIWEGAEIQQEALDVNGFTLDEITDKRKPSLEELTMEFMSWIDNIQNKTFAGHNVWFDIGFLRDSIKRTKLKGFNNCTNFAHRNIDLHSETYTHHLKRNLLIPIKNNRTAITSNYAFNYVGLPLEPMPHRALTGAKMEAEALNRLIYGKLLLPEFEKYSIPEYLK